MQVQLDAHKPLRKLYYLFCTTIDLYRACVQLSTKLNEPCNFLETQRHVVTAWPSLVDHILSVIQIPDSQPMFDCSRTKASEC